MNKYIPGSTIRTPDDIAVLPHDFLNPDPLKLAAASVRNRNMNALAAAHEDLQASGLAGYYTGSRLLSEFDPVVQEHMARGAALAWDMISQAAPDVAAPRSTVGASHGMGPRPDPYHQQLRWAEMTLGDMREQAGSPDDPRVQAAVDVVLGRAGLREAMANALTHIKDPRLKHPKPGSKPERHQGDAKLPPAPPDVIPPQEETTRSAAARYGAAIVALNAAAAATFPAEPPRPQRRRP